MSALTHRAWIELSARALETNVSEITALLGESIFGAVVKANAYGHGLAPVVGALARRGQKHFIVDTLEEAGEVRQLVGDEPSLFVVGAIFEENAEEAVALGVIQNVSTPEVLSALIEAAKKSGGKARITLEIETGLYRLGAPERQWRDLARICREHGGHLEVVGIASHLASAEDAGKLKVQEQNKVFCDAITFFQEQGIEPRVAHLAPSAATILHPPTLHGLTRVGLMMYGLWPSAATRREATLGRRHVNLAPVLSFKTRLVEVKHVPLGGGVGYGSTFVARRPLQMGVIPVGYADGLDRGFSNQGHVLVRGAKCPIIGKVCMNMSMVDLSPAPSNIRAGDTVTLIGRDGMNTISADDWATQLGTINYEITTRLSRHLPRVLVS